MSGALAVRDDLPDLLGTAPSDLIENTDEFADTVTARRRAERIRAHLVSYAQMRQDIADAFAYRDWAALGYSSWYGYLEGEFGPELQQLARNRDERQAAVRDLRAGGLSTRRIADLTGVDAKTVRNDLAGADQPAEVQGADGKTYPASRGSQAATGTPAGSNAGDESPAGPAASTPDPRADAATPADRPGPHPTDSPAGRDPESSPGDPAVATTGQPGNADELAGVGADYERDPQKRIAAVAAVAPAFVQPVSPAEVRAERRERIGSNFRSLSLALVQLLELAAEGDPDDMPLDALRQQRDGLNLLIRRIENTATAQEGSTS